MFHHVVMVGFALPLAAQDRRFILDRCRRIEDSVAGVLAMRFVENRSARSPQFTHALVAQFADEAAHDRYQANPLHDELRQKFAELKKEMAVLDYLA